MAPPFEGCVGVLSCVFLFVVRSRERAQLRERGLQGSGARTHFFASCSTVVSHEVPTRNLFYY